MLRRYGAFALVAMAAVIWSAPGIAAGIGTVKLVKEWAYERLMPGDWDDLFIEDEVFSNQRIRTPPDAAVHVHLVDGADFRVGANSEVVIDKYVYDPSRNTGQFVTTLGKGAFRFISGKVKDYKIQTPSATIGIRGTDIIVAVLDSENTVMQVNQGAAVMTPCSSATGRFECAGTPILVAIGRTAGVVEGGNEVQFGVNVPQDPGLNDDGGLAELTPQAGGGGRRNTGFGSDNQEFVDPCESNPSNPVCTVQSNDVTSPDGPTLR